MPGLYRFRGNHSLTQAPCQRSNPRGVLLCLSAFRAPLDTLRRAPPKIETSRISDSPELRLGGQSEVFVLESQISSV